MTDDGSITLLAAGTADCPMATVLMGGATDTEYEAFSTAESDWSDGANASITFTTDTTFQAAIIAETSFMYTAGVGLTAITTAPNGVYGVGATVGDADSDSTVEEVTSVLAGWYSNTAAVASATDFQLGGDEWTMNVENVSSSDDHLKYDYTTAPTPIASGDTILQVDDTIAVTWLLPAEPDTIPDGETTTTGDRWNTGDMLVLYASFDDGATNAECTASGGVELALGAAFLAASGVASAAVALGI